MLTHNKSRVTGHFGFVHRDDYLWTGEFLLVVIREMTSGQFPITELGRAGYKPRGFHSLHFLHNDLEHNAVSTSGPS